MNIKFIIYIPLVVLLLGLIFLYRLSLHTEGVFQQVIEKQILIAVGTVEPTLSSMQNNSGYQTWTPSKAVEQLIPTLNSALLPLEGEPELPGIAGNIRYVKNKVSDSYQVVLIPIDYRRLIRIEGYGQDISKPIFSKEFEVPEF